MPKVKVDFSDTESRGGKKGRGARKHYAPGDYAVKCTKAELTKSSEKETPGIALTFKIIKGKEKGKEITDVLWLSPKALWRVRQTLEAMTIKVPTKRIQIDTAIMVGKSLAISLDDEEYDEKVYSRVVDAFLLAELNSSEDEEEEETDEEVDEDEEEETDDDDDDEDEDLEEIDI